MYPQRTGVLRARDNVNRESEDVMGSKKNKKSDKPWRGGGRWRGWRGSRALALALLGFALLGGAAWGSAASAEGKPDFPPSLDSYGDADLTSIPEILAHRIEQQPFNLVASIIFLCAIVHTFMAGKFSAVSHRRRAEHDRKIESGEARPGSVDILGEVCHFLGEVEVVFGLWAIPLIVAIVVFTDWSTAVGYIDHGVNMTEPAFVVVIMVLASTRPILLLAESIMLRLAGLLGGTLAAFWITVMTVGPLLGSFITEPAAMTITALLLSKKFYDLEPSDKFSSTPPWGCCS